MKILKKNQFNKREDISVIPFLEYYYRGLNGKIYFSAIPENNNKRPDYLVDSTKALIEIKEIHDRISNQKHAQWGTIVNKLQKATNDNKLLAKVKGTYLINTPEVFKLYKFEIVSSQIIQEIIKGVDKQKIINILGIDFEINKVSDQESVVVYGSMGGAGFIDPANVVYQNIKDKIETANKQLSFNPEKKKPTKRILLLVNKYYFPLYEWDLFKAISLAYSNLSHYENIDEIWYQLETREKGYIHKLLYRRSFFEKFRSESLSDVQKDEYKMFASWFSALSEMGDEYKHKLLIALQFFLKQNKAYSIFPDGGDREQMVRLGLWLVEKNLIKEANWLINQFINDPDPVEPGKYKGKPEFNYDQLIRDGKDAVVVTTVMGHLAWVVKELARKSARHDIASLISAYTYTEKVLGTKKNLYILQQWLVPLVEIANRRLWLAEDDPATYLRFRKLILDKKTGLVAKYSKYPALAKFLIDIFDFFKDLTTEEAKFVLDNLINSDEGFRLLVYYAFYREKHYKKDSDIGKVMGEINPGIFSYSSTYAKDKLNEVSLDKENKYAKLRSHLAWQCWRILDESRKEFGQLEQLLDNLFKSPYNKETFSNLFHIIEEKYGEQTKQCHVWLMEYIRKMSDYAVDDEKGRKTWTSMDQVINKVADYKPEDLPTILESLTEIWLKGAYIGDLNVIFTAYQNIKDNNLKQQVKQLSQKLHKEIEAVNPRVKDIGWI